MFWSLKLFLNFEGSFLYAMSAYLEILTQVNVFFCVYVFVYANPVVSPGMLQYQYNTS